MTDQTQQQMDEVKKAVNGEKKSRSLPQLWARRDKIKDLITKAHEGCEKEVAELQAEQNEISETLKKALE